jgi:hypothetical protein
MTQDEIIRMAREAGDWNGQTAEFNEVGLEHFAALVRAEALEEAAKVCEEGINNAEDWDSSYWDQCCENCAAAIRGLK